MKPSQRIEELRQKLIIDDWVAFGGNLYSREGWLSLCNDGENKMKYLWKALMTYLDEEVDH